MVGIAAYADDQVEPGIRRGLAAFRMQTRSVVAQFEHLPGDQDPPLCMPRRKGLDHGSQRLGV